MPEVQSKSDLQRLFKCQFIFCFRRLRDMRIRQIILDELCRRRQGQKTNLPDSGLNFMKRLENLFSILYYFFNLLADICWGGKEILREIREGREPDDSEPDSKKHKRKS